MGAGTPTLGQDGQLLPLPSSIGGRRSKKYSSQGTLFISPTYLSEIFRLCRQFGYRKSFWGMSPNPQHTII